MAGEEEPTATASASAPGERGAAPDAPAETVATPATAPETATTPATATAPTSTPQGAGAAGPEAETGLPVRESQSRALAIPPP
eukprot:12815454-Alexandrium_andersonii.AAC.1